MGTLPDICCHTARSVYAIDVSTNADWVNPPDFPASNRPSQEICWKLCSQFFDVDLANLLLERCYNAQPSSLLGQYG